MALHFLEEVEIEVIVLLPDLDPFLFGEIAIFLDLLQLSLADHLVVLPTYLTCQWPVLLQKQHHLFIVSFFTIFTVVEAIHGLYHIFRAALALRKCFYRIVGYILQILIPIHPLSNIR